MVVAHEQLERFAGRAHPDRCSHRPRGRITRCSLAPGHAGYHSAQVSVRRANGQDAGYTHFWLA